MGLFKNQTKPNETHFGSSIGLECVLLRASTSAVATPRRWKSSLTHNLRFPT